MVKRRKLNSSKGGTPSYEVGRGKPPKHSQFQPGQSGNPAGRRKGLRNLRTDVLKTLSMKVRVRDGDGVRTRSMQEAIVMLLGQKASQGDLRSIIQILELAARFNTDPLESEARAPLGSDDKAILEAFADEVRSLVPRPVSQAARRADRRPK